MARPLRVSSCHGARVACALRVNGAPTALTAFARRLHSEVNLNNWQGPHITSPA